VYAVIGGVGFSFGLFVAPLATFLIRIFGTRVVVNVGAVFVGVGLIAASFATQQWHLLLSQGICFGCGAGFLFVSTVNIVPQWFLRRRSVATGITSAGMGVGGLTYSLGVGTMIPRLGVSWTYRILGIIAVTVIVIAANLLRDRNKAVGSRHNAFQASLFKRMEFILFLAWGAFSMLGYIVLIFSLSNFAASIGLSPHQGSIISALVNLGQAVGRPLAGLSSDRYGRINIAGLLTFLTGVFCLVVWIFAHSMGVACLFAILVGVAGGVYWATVGPVLAEIISLQDLPSAFSLTWLIMVAPSTASEPIALELRTRSTSSAYLRVQIFTGIMFISASACLWIVRGWKVCEMRRKEALAIAVPDRNELLDEGKSGHVDPTRRSPQTDASCMHESSWSLANLCRGMTAVRWV
jgi:MFS family permease